MNTTELIALAQSSECEVIEVTHSEDEIGEWHNVYSFDIDQLAKFAELLAKRNAENDKPVACYTKAYGVQMLKHGFLQNIPDNTLLYLHPTLPAEQDAEQQASYGYCPICGKAGIKRERRPNGFDTCYNGHKYLSAEAIANRKDGV